MLADSRASELHAIALAIHSDQREIAGAAADVANQHELSIEQALLRLGQVIGDPGIKCRSRLFHQRELFDPGVARRLHGKLACFFVKRRRNSQHYVLFR